MSPAGAGGGGAALRVVRGEPSAEELAALVAVVAARSGGAPSGGQGDRFAVGGWADRGALVRHPLTPGPGAWAAAVRP